MNGHPLSLPWDCRDKADLAKAAYESPFRTVATKLSEENIKLKKLLRENGISWSPTSIQYFQHHELSERRIRPSRHRSGSATLPTEVLLRILTYALTSPTPLIDPLSARTRTNLTKAEFERPHQIAIHFLATCKALHTEGSRILWEENEFIFTSHTALRHFGELQPRYRVKISHITLRIIARYYDDQRRKHRLSAVYHPALKGESTVLKTNLRPTESPLARSGFRCYAWTQIVDFLLALRAPYDPSHSETAQPQTRLLPALTSLRIDLVNFTDSFLPFADADLHNLASHEMGCILNELQITGMPVDDAGIRATVDLSGLLKDDGLLLDGLPAFIALKGGLKPLKGKHWSARVIRAWIPGVGEDPGHFEAEDDFDDLDELSYALLAHRSRLGLLPPAPFEKDAPRTYLCLKKFVWKRVPTHRDGIEREWKLFSRFDGDETCHAPHHDGSCDV